MIEYFWVDGRLSGCFVAPVQNWIKWLLVLGVFAGLSGRLAMAYVGHEPACASAVESCGSHDSHHHHETPVSGEEDQESGPSCPPGPHEHRQHNHGACCLNGAINAESHTVCRLPAPLEMRADLAFGLEKAPDEPVFPMDKPPLI